MNDITIRGQSVQTLFICIKYHNLSWYFNKMVLQNTLRSDVSAILKSIHVRKIVRMGEAMIDR